MGREIAFANYSIGASDDLAAPVTATGSSQHGISPGR